MADDLSLQPPPPPQPAGAGPVAEPCCAQCDPTTMRPCELCKKPACRFCRGRVNGRAVCSACRDQVAAELKAEEAGGGHLPGAIVGGVVAALISGAVWAAIVVAAGVQIGYVAVGVGWLAGQGVVLGSGGRKGFNLQIIAVLSSVLGLLLGKYFALAYLIKGEMNKSLPGSGDQVSALSVEMFNAFCSVFTRMLSPWDILWLILAFSLAWSVPKPAQVSVR